MPSVTHHHAGRLDRILVIDDLPLIPLAFQEVFRSVNPSASVAYCGNVFTALSAKAYAGMTFDLVIIGLIQDLWSNDLEQTTKELIDRFGRPSIMLYSGAYDPLIIENMQVAGIDAYVHRLEPIEEIRKLYLDLSAGQTFISGIFRTLYEEYGFGVKK
jgi:hypothetical protein